MIRPYRFYYVLELDLRKNLDKVILAYTLKVL